MPPTPPLAGIFTHPGEGASYEGKWRGAILHSFRSTLRMDDANSYTGEVANVTSMEALIICPSIGNTVR